ncbi:MAG: helix-turn-helix domain-containing protein [Nitrospinota bacterium]|nr:helix-turn-helix domain-containing protein [Nitrospinota bacterium]MDH5677359.1 helix-turn-helix domain-containing protein [Nitrospinota bacterium]MDH5756101.1 helix-turn-helix domain-containing protein [Nitrospinota bacterium]
MDFLTVEEVAIILKSHTNTIYKMCRQGILPAVKIGPSWRIERKKLATFMEAGAPPQKTDTFKGLVSLALKTGHYMGIFSLEKDILDFELTYFSAALAQNPNSFFFKACWWQHPDDARRHLSSLKIDVDEMEGRGALVIANMSEIYRKHGVNGVLEKWKWAADHSTRNGFSGMVGTGAKHIDCCDGRHHPLLEVENGINKISNSQPMTILCTYLMDQGASDIFPRIFEVTLMHDQFFIQTEDTEIMAKVTYSLTHSTKR